RRLEDPALILDHPAGSTEKIVAQRALEHRVLPGPALESVAVFGQAAGNRATHARGRPDTGSRQGRDDSFHAAALSQGANGRARACAGLAIPPRAGPAD